MSIKRDYKSVIFSGCAIESKSISLCDLRHFLPQYKGYVTGAYQVHSDNPRCKYSEIFKDIDEAVNKFVELKGSLR